jgi:hypothetical protein
VLRTRGVSLGMADKLKKVSPPLWSAALQSRRS